MEKTRVGKLYGAEERVLERVVTYLCLSGGAWNTSLDEHAHAHSLYRDDVMHKSTNTSSV